MSNSTREHTFVICAYKESPYLEACIQSLLNQTCKSKVLIATSTPNDLIHSLADQYHLPVYVNDGEHGITQDWNFALSLAETKYATIAHQDDIYDPEYLETLLNAMSKKPHTLIAFPDYYELRDGARIEKNRLLTIKKILLLPLRPACMSSVRFVRRLCLSFGDPIGCPSVSFNLDNLERPIFQHGYRSCEDWQAWEKISRMKGDFVYIPKPLMGHRIHQDSETSKIIQDNARTYENYTMFCKFWPKWIARLLSGVYSKSDQSNNI